MHVEQTVIEPNVLKVIYNFNLIGHWDVFFYLLIEFKSCVLEICNTNA